MAYWYDGAALAATRSPVIALFWCLIKFTTTTTTMPLLNRPAHSKATLGDRSFSFASSSVRNSIPNDVRCAPSLS